MPKYANHVGAACTCRGDSCGEWHVHDTKGSVKEICRPSVGYAVKGDHASAALAGLIHSGVLEVKSKQSRST